MQAAANNCGKPKRKRPCCEGPGLFRSCCPNVAATYRVVAQRCPGALARALESPMFVRLKGGDIPQPSRMGNIGWLPIVASVCSMLPPRHKRYCSPVRHNYDSDVRNGSILETNFRGGHSPAIWGRGHSNMYSNNHSEVAMVRCQGNGNMPSQGYLLPVPIVPQILFQIFLNFILVL
jgi:hypothetical protein